MPDRKVTVRLRPEVQWFAEQMEKRLRKHDSERGKRGWLNEDRQFLRERIDEELEELDRSLDRRSLRSIGDAADVANFAMMLADIVRDRWSEHDALSAESRETKGAKNG